VHEIKHDGYRAPHAYFLGARVTDRPCHWSRAHRPSLTRSNRATWHTCPIGGRRHHGSNWLRLVLAPTPRFPGVGVVAVPNRGDRS
jgi:hypothetical protein